MKYITNARNKATLATDELAAQSTELAILLKEANRMEAHRMKIVAVNARLALMLLAESGEILTGDQFIRARNNLLHELQEVMV